MAGWKMSTSDFMGTLSFLLPAMPLELVGADRLAVALFFFVDTMPTFL